MGTGEFNAGRCQGERERERGGGEGGRGFDWYGLYHAQASHSEEGVKRLQFASRFSNRDKLLRTEWTSRSDTDVT